MLCKHQFNFVYNRLVERRVSVNHVILRHIIVKYILFMFNRSNVTHYDLPDSTDALTFVHNFVHHVFGT